MRDSHIKWQGCSSSFLEVKKSIFFYLLGCSASKDPQQELLCYLSWVLNWQKHDRGYSVVLKLLPLKDENISNHAHKTGSLGTSYKFFSKFPTSTGFVFVREFPPPHREIRLRNVWQHLSEVVVNANSRSGRRCGVEGLGFVDDLRYNKPWSALPWPLTSLYHWLWS